MSNLRDIFKKYRLTIAILSIFVGLLYSYYTLHELTNVGDGFWQQSYYFAANHERSIGRWIWPYVDIFQRGLHMEPVNMLATLAIFILGYILTLFLFDIPDGWLTAIGGCLFFSSPIFSVIVSYRYMAIIYALSFLSAVLAASSCEKIKNGYIAISLGAVCFSISMGLYQSYIGVFCVIGLFSFMLIILENEELLEKLLEKIVRYFSAFLLGGILYYISLKINLYLTGTQISDYDGANQISVIAILKNLPFSIKQTYNVTMSYINGTAMKLSILNKFNVNKIVYCVLFLVFVGIVLAELKQEQKLSVLKGILLLLCILLIPVAVFAANILALGGGFMPQTGGPLAFFFSFVFVLLCKVISKKQFNYEKVVLGIITGCCIVTIYGQTLQVLIDHKVMQEDYTATVSLMQGLAQDLNSKGMLTSDKEYFFIGMPSENPLFGKSELRIQANEYAKVGSFWLSGTNMHASYAALLQSVMGMNIQVSYDKYESKAFDEYYQNMPCYPNGEYAVAWDTIIVKVSDP